MSRFDRRDVRAQARQTTMAPVPFRMLIFRVR